MKAMHMRGFFAKLLAAAVGIGCLAAAVPIAGLARAEGETESYGDAIVSYSATEERPGFTVLVQDADEGDSVTLSQEPVSFEYEYLAVSFLLSYSNGEGGDRSLPLKLQINGTSLQTEGMLAAIDAEGTQTEIATQDGYFVLTPEFKGTIYFPAALLGGAEEISQFGVSVDGTHDAEFVVLNAYGCQNTGDPLEEPVINDNNMIVTADEGIEVAAGFQITKTGTVQNNGVHIVQDPVPFDSKYLGIELAVTETVQFENDHNILFKIAINGNDPITPEHNTLFPVACRDSDRSTIVNMYGGWFVLPEFFDGMLYLEAEAYLEGATEISQIDFLFDEAHTGEMTVRNIFGCEEIGSAYNPLTGTIFFKGEQATISATNVENTGFNTYAGFKRYPAEAVGDNKYLAVYVKFDSFTVADPADHFTYVSFTVNGILLPEMGNLTGYPADGSGPVQIEHKWGNWVVIPDSFEGVIYFPLETYLPGITALESFQFGFDGSHMQNLAYKIGFAEEAGGVPVYIDLTKDKEAEIVKHVARFENYLPDERTTKEVVELASFAEENLVYSGDGLEVFDTYTDTEVRFGGVWMEEKSWENSLVVHVKSPMEGGKPVNSEESVDPYGFIEFNLDAPTELLSGIAVNVQCLSGECYFRVYLIDENGCYWSPSYGGTYPLVAEGAPGEMQTLYQNFYYQEEDYGTLYLPKTSFVLDAYYSGENTPSDGMGKIVKIAFSFDMLNGLGREMCIGSIANVELDWEAGILNVTRLFVPSSMTDEELGIGTVAGTVVSSPSAEIHVANFVLQRETLEQTPGYLEPSNPGNPDDGKEDPPDGNQDKEEPTDNSGGKTDVIVGVSIAAAVVICGAVVLTVVLVRRRRR